MVSKAVKALMPISVSKIFNLRSHHEDLSQKGFTLVEVLVALLLATLIFFAIPSGDSAATHRALEETVNDLDRTVRFASNEAILRNTVVRIRIMLEKNPVEYTVEYGPQGNIPLPDMPEKLSLSLDEEADQKKRLDTFDKQFTKVEEFEDIKKELPLEVTILGVATENQKDIQVKDSANIYFYPTGEKDAALIFFSTVEEIAYLEMEPYLPETRANFEELKLTGIAKVEDVIQTRMDEVHKEWLKP